MESRIDAEGIEHSSSDSDSQSDGDFGEWDYGDGICPPLSQFNLCCQSSYDTWAAAALTSPNNSTAASSLLHIENFLSLLQDVPPFFHNPPKDVNIMGERKSPFILRMSLEVETTRDSTCEQRWRNIDYFQCLGFPRPQKCNTKKNTHLPPHDLPGQQARPTGLLYKYCFGMVIYHLLSLG